MLKTVLVKDLIEDDSPGVDSRDPLEFIRKVRKAMATIDEPVDSAWVGICDTKGGRLEEVKEIVSRSSVVWKHRRLRDVAYEDACICRWPENDDTFRPA